MTATFTRRAGEAMARRMKAYDAVPIAQKSLLGVVQHIASLTNDPEVKGQFRTLENEIQAAQARTKSYKPTSPGKIDFDFWRTVIPDQKFVDRVQTEFSKDLDRVNAKANSFNYEEFYRQYPGMRDHIQKTREANTATRKQLAEDIITHHKWMRQQEAEIMRSLQWYQTAKTAKIEDWVALHPEAAADAREELERGEWDPISQPEAVGRIRDRVARRYGVTLPEPGTEEEVLPGYSEIKTEA
eukprot:TRINITY_DN18686_c0_g1_i1.p1 TRINITY_DN18686_c0_g1~~TRINITY_DN18686_c0_g1_i1.p1  ORF type:complete len:242 (-),score=59.35 TRINITY_DN18686_c0_g1_i1:376-1101(-)